MTSLTELWIDNKDFIVGKTIQQVIAFCGDGKLKDGATSSTEFRSFIKNIPSSLLSQYANECLEMVFPQNGLVLQDIVNQMGNRIGFDVEYGLYQGRKNRIGYDGIWTAAYMAYGCGSADITALIPFEVIEPLISDFWTTENEDRMYWHVVIHQKDGKLLLQIPKKKQMKDISKFII